MFVDLYHWQNWFLPSNSSSGNSSSPGFNSDPSEPSQTVSKLLLLSIFSVAARYLDESTPEPIDKIWEAGCDYLTQARSVVGTCDFLSSLSSWALISFWLLAQVTHSCRVSTCQALLLLGHREFGIGMVLCNRLTSVLIQLLGSMEQGWLYIGVVILVAYLCLAY